MPRHPACLILFSCVLSELLFAQSTPQVIKLQGSLIQSGVGPVTGTVTMTIALHDAPTGGQPLAVVGPMPVAVNEGAYAVDLPFPLTAFGGASRFIEITVNGEVLAPRVPMGSSAFAYVADTLDGRHAAELEESAEVEERMTAHEATADPHPTYVLRTGDNMTGNLQVAGIVESLAGGFRFPDGSMQLSAATGGGAIGPGSFGDIATGINTSADMVVGPGASLSATDGGTITATSAPGYLPLGGGAMTGAVTLDNASPGIVLPISADIRNPSAIEFKAQGTAGVNASWYVTNHSLPSGAGSEDHVLRWSYNMLGGRRMTSGEHWWSMELESGFGPDRDYLEWVINIDPNQGAAGPVSKSIRDWFWYYNRIKHQVGFQIGALPIDGDPAPGYQPADPNDFFFGMNRFGYAGFVLMGRNGSDTSANTVFMDATRAATWDPNHQAPDDPLAQSRISIDPGGVKCFAGMTDRAAFICGDVGDMTFDPGLRPNGTTRGQLRFGWNRPTRSVFGPGVVNNATLSVNGESDQVQFSVQGHLTQTRSLMLLEQSGGTDVFAVSNGGDGTFLGAVTGSNLSGTNTGDVAGGRGITLSGGNYDVDPELYTQTRCLNVNPDSPVTDLLFFRADTAITITGIDCLVDSADALGMTLMECDQNGGRCRAIEATLICQTANTTETDGIDDAAVEAGHYLRVQIGMKSGSPAQGLICATFTVDD